MIAILSHLSEEEQAPIYNAPILIAILIAGADGTIDEGEIKMAKSISKLKKKIDNKDLQEYYSMIGNNLEDKLRIGINRLPGDPGERHNIINEELKKLNKILPKVDRTFAILYYESLKLFAEMIAKASGGFLGFKSIGEEEAELIKLDMITDPKMSNQELENES